MDRAKLYGYAKIAAGVLLTLLVVNTIANRVPAVKSARDKINTGLLSVNFLNIKRGLWPWI